jgi:hypothetical protein
LSACKIIGNYIGSEQIIEAKKSFKIIFGFGIILNII